MEATALTFEKQDGTYVCQLPDTEKLGGVIQLVQNKRGIVSISANIAGLPEAVVQTIENPYGNTVLFELNLPDNLAVTIKSATEVTEGVWMR